MKRVETQNLSELPLFTRAMPVNAISDALPEVAVQPKRLTVTELTTQMRKVLEPAFTQVWVQGEVSNYRPATSGHAYFSLKDAGASIAVAMFGWGARKKGFELKDGVQVLCRGKIAIYSPRGNYQLIVDQLEPLGAGALQVAFEQLKARLAAEGLFESSRKRALPRFPLRLVIVTSPTGAAIQDMLTVLRRRAPQIQITIIPAIVQGAEAAAQIQAGLEMANREQLGDLIVLARGGGSIEDLWCFNHENLARAIVNSQIPVVSAVGHEIDFTISDFVADYRAPTPSAAAEVVSSEWAEARGRAQELAVRLKSTWGREWMARRTLLAHLSARLVSPRDRLREQMQRLDEMSHRLTQAVSARLERRRAGLEQGVGKLNALSPLRVLERGYTLVSIQDEHQQKRIIKSSVELKSDQLLEILFHDGQRMVRTL